MIAERERPPSIIQMIRVGDRTAVVDPSIAQALALPKHPGSDWIVNDENGRNASLSDLLRGGVFFLSYGLGPIVQVIVEFIGENADIIKITAA